MYHDGLALNYYNSYCIVLICYKCIHPLTIILSHSSYNFVFHQIYHPGPGAGVTYIRWGKSSCPNVTGTQLIYAGRASGAAFNSPGGGGGEILCLPLNPD